MGRGLDVVTGRMYNGKGEHGVGKLSVKPDAFVKRNPGDLWPYPAKYGPAHWKQDQGCVDAEHQSRPARDPNRILQNIDTCQSFISCLCIPILTLVTEEAKPSRRTREPKMGWQP